MNDHLFLTAIGLILAAAALVITTTGVAMKLYGDYRSDRIAKQQEEKIGSTHSHGIPAPNRRTIEAQDKQSATPH